MLRIAARRLSSLSSPSTFRSTSPANVYSTVVSKSPFSEARSTFSAPHFYSPFRGFATEHGTPKAEHGVVSDVPPTGDPSKKPFAYSVLTGVRKAAYLPASVFSSVFMHINTGIEEIVADYVHQEMTRNWILICLRLFFILMIKDVLFLCL